MTLIRVLIVDDCPAMRRGLRAMLSKEPTIEVVGERDSTFGALEQPPSLRPNVILLDACMPQCNPMNAASRLRERFPEARLLFLLDHDHLGAPGTIPLGGDGYLVNAAPEQQLIDAVLALSSGQQLLAGECARLFLEQYESATRELIRRRASLSDQEVELLRQLAAGATTEEIAARMYLSEITVFRKIQQVVGKLGVANRTQAVAEALRRAII